MRIKYGITDQSFKLITGNDRYSKVEHVYSLSSKNLVACRGDWAAFQVILEADEEYSVNVGDSPWFSQKGQILNLRIETNISLPVKTNLIGMVEDDDLFKKADIIFSQQVIEVNKNTPQATWIEITIPENTKPGIYKGSVSIYQNRMFSNEEKIGELTFNLEVNDLIMPKPQEYSFHLDLWQHISNIARKHEVGLYSEEHFKILESYVLSLSQLGQKAITIVASEIPWRGQGCYNEHRTPSNMFEYSIIGVTKEIDGSYSYDYSAMQRYIDLCFIHQIDSEIEVFGLVNVWGDESKGFGKVADSYPDGISIRYLDRSDRCYKYLSQANEIEEYIKNLEQYFVNKGLIDKVRIVADEPGDIVAYRQSIERIISVAPSFKFKTAINHVEFIEEFSKEISDFVPYIQCLSKGWDKIQKYKTELKDKRYLWYVCCGPAHPNTFIRSNLLESRFIGLFTSYAELDGFLRWNYTVWPENPRRSIKYGSWAAGDTNFVYPGYDGRALLTLRYKNFKKGIEDFELLNLLKKKEKFDIIEKVFSKIVVQKDISKYYYDDELISIEKICSLDPQDYFDARKLMIEALCN